MGIQKTDTNIDPDGKTVSSRSMMLDICDRKEAEITRHNLHNNVQSLEDRRMAELVEANARLKQKIEERKKAEKELKKSGENFKALVENVNDGIILLEGNRRCN